MPLLSWHWASTRFLSRVHVCRCCKRRGQACNTCYATGGITAASSVYALLGCCPCLLVGTLVFGSGCIVLWACIVLLVGFLSTVSVKVRLLVTNQVATPLMGVHRFVLKLVCLPANSLTCTHVLRDGVAAALSALVLPGSHWLQPVSLALLEALQSVYTTCWWVWPRVCLGFEMFEPCLVHTPFCCFTSRVRQ